MSIDTENHDPEFVQRANGKLIFGGAMVGMVFFICAIGFLMLFGVPSSEQGGAQQQAASQQQPAAAR